MLHNHPSITRAAGGGVGGGDFNYNSSFSQYAKGTMKLGQGYWIKSDSDTSLTYTKASLGIASVDLKVGWNLVNTCVEIDSSNILNDYPSIERAAGGGVGGGGDFNYNRQFSQYAKGITKLGQGYWFKVDQDMSITCTSPYEFRAWNNTGNNNYLKLTTMLNGVNYTLAVYSKLDIAFGNTSTSGVLTTLVGNLNTKDIVDILVIAEDYNTHDVVVKVFKDANNFTEENLVAISEPLLANNGFLNYNITIQNPDDYRPIAPTDTNIAMSPVAPSF